MARRTVIIGIHGLANKPPKEEKAKWWRAAMSEGFRRNGGAEPPDFDFEFVYWANLRYGAPLDEERNLEPYYPDDGHGAFPSPEHDAVASAPTLVDRLYRTLDWVQEKTGVAPLDEVILEYRLDDLWGYYEDAAFRDAARACLRASLHRHAGSRILIAAHSMGSLITYDVLRAMERDGVEVDIAHLVTMGAPLGLGEIKLKLTAEHGDLRVPRAVAHWTNLIDREDVATVGEDLGDIYEAAAGGTRVRDLAVLNTYRRPSGERNHHKSYGYLRTPEFSRAVLAFLAGADASADREGLGGASSAPGIEGRNGIAQVRADPV